MYLHNCTMSKWLDFKWRNARDFFVTQFLHFLETRLYHIVFIATYMLASMYCFANVVYISLHLSGFYKKYVQTEWWKCVVSFVCCFRFQNLFAGNFPIWSSLGRKRYHQNLLQSSKKVIDMTRSAKAQRLSFRVQLVSEVQV